MSLIDCFHITIKFKNFRELFFSLGKKQRRGQKIFISKMVDSKENKFHFHGWKIRPWLSLLDLAAWALHSCS